MLRGSGHPCRISQITFATLLSNHCIQIYFFSFPFLISDVDTLPGIQSWQFATGRQYRKNPQKKRLIFKVLRISVAKTTTPFRRSRRAQFPESVFHLPTRLPRSISKRAGRSPRREARTPPGIEMEFRPSHLKTKYPLMTCRRGLERARGTRCPWPQPPVHL